MSGTPFETNNPEGASKIVKHKDYTEKTFVIPSLPPARSMYDPLQLNKKKNQNQVEIQIPAQNVAGMGVSAMKRPFRLRPIRSGGMRNILKKDPTQPHLGVATIRQAFKPLFKMFGLIASGNIFKDFGTLAEALSDERKFARAIFGFIFSMYDEDQSGEIESDELQSLLKDIGEATGDVGLIHITKNTLEKVMQDVDEDKNGTIDQKEFVDYMVSWIELDDEMENEILQDPNNGEGETEGEGEDSREVIEIKEGTEVEAFEKNSNSSTENENLNKSLMIKNFDDNDIFEKDKFKVKKKQLKPMDEIKIHNLDSRFLPKYKLEKEEKNNKLDVEKPPRRIPSSHDIKPIKTYRKLSLPPLRVSALELSSDEDEEEESSSTSLTIEKK